jgi:transcriptional regulator with XRE-family HTH domain
VSEQERRALSAGRIRQSLNDRGWSQARLVREIRALGSVSNVNGRMMCENGVGVQTTNRYVRGHRVPSVSWIEAAACALGVSPAWLIAWDDEG